MKLRLPFSIKKRVLMEDSSDYSSAYYSDRSSLPPQPAERKSKVLEDILEKLGPIDQVSYTPFKITICKKASLEYPCCGN
jgi:hypothetical protein